MARLTYIVPISRPLTNASTGGSGVATMMATEFAVPFLLRQLLRHFVSGPSSAWRRQLTKLTAQMLPLHCVCSLHRRLDDPCVSKHEFKQCAGFSSARFAKAKRTVLSPSAPWGKHVQLWLVAQQPSVTHKWIHPENVQEILCSSTASSLTNARAGSVAREYVQATGGANTFYTQQFDHSW